MLRYSKAFPRKLFQDLSNLKSRLSFGLYWVFLILLVAFIRKPQIKPMYLNFYIQFFDIISLFRISVCLPFQLLARTTVAHQHFLYTF